MGALSYLVLGLIFHRNKQIAIDNRNRVSSMKVKSLKRVYHLWGSAADIRWKGVWPGEKSYWRQEKGDLLLYRSKNFGNCINKEDKRVYFMDSMT
jgi:hypothetical protein